MKMMTWDLVFLTKQHCNLFFNCYVAQRLKHLIVFTTVMNMLDLVSIIFMMYINILNFTLNVVSFGTDVKPRLYSDSFMKMFLLLYTGSIRFVKHFVLNFMCVYSIDCTIFQKHYKHPMQLDVQHTVC